MRVKGITVLVIVAIIFTVAIWPVSPLIASANGYTAAPIQMSITVNGLAQGETATLLIGTETPNLEVKNAIFEYQIYGTGTAIKADVAPDLEDGNYLLMLDAPSQYFRDPKGYLFNVRDSAIVNPTGKAIIFNLKPQPTYLAAEAVADLSAPPKQPIQVSIPVSPNQTPVNRDVAIMIAKADVPTNIIGEASIQTLWDESKWTVHFMLNGNNTVTKNEIGWPESPNNRFINQGLLSEGTYRLLTFTIDRRTGAVLSRQASDSVLLGGPGTFNTEPPEATFFPLWSVVASGIGGLVVGGIVIWLIMHRKKTSIAV